MPAEPEPPAPAPADPEYPEDLPYTTVGNGFRVIDYRAILVGNGPEYGPRNQHEPASLSAIDHISIHHWAGAELGIDDVHAEYRLLLQIRDFHRNTRGWPGYAYHFTIFPSGRIYYTGDMATLRFVVKTKNRQSLAIAFAGNYMTQPPTELALRSAVQLLRELDFELDAVRRWGRQTTLLGHKEVPGTDPTACPGDTWPQWQPRLVLSYDVPVPPTNTYDDRTEQGANIARAVQNAALWEVPTELPLGGAIAESSLLNANRRPKNAAQDAASWPDVSEGVLQQTVAWSDEYLEQGGDPETYPGPDVTERILALYRDPDHAFEKAMPQLHQKFQEAGGNVLDALCLYNWPAQDPARNPNRGNYARGLRIAARILRGEHWRNAMEAE